MTTQMPQATLNDYVNHIDYIVKRIGVDHVGIGNGLQSHGTGIIGFNDEIEAMIPQTRPVV
jgi:membrane dipeptidase